MPGAGRPAAPHLVLAELRPQPAGQPGQLTLLHCSALALQTVVSGTEVSSVLVVPRLRPADSNTVISCIAHNNQLEVLAHSTAQSSELTDMVEAKL